ncbi:hypothetical protein [Anaeromassilibacillus senegalensis]|nr:hypothetical protein [Anaeromassilibacillus senegalensis]
MNITIDLSVEEMTDIIAKAMRTALLEPETKPDGMSKEAVERFREAMREK